MSFFDPVYQNDSIQMNNDESDSELSVNSLSRQTFRDKNQGESSETLDAVPTRNPSQRNENNETFDDDQSPDVIINKENYFSDSKFFNLIRFLYRKLLIV